MAGLDHDIIDEIKERFEIFDKIGDGKIAHHEIINVLRALGMNPITEDVDKVIEQSELKGKRIDLETFCAIFQEVSEKPVVATMEDMIEALKTFDKTSSGNIFAAQLRQILVNLGDKLTEKQADYIIGKFEDDQGLIPYLPMLRTMCSTDAE